MHDLADPAPGAHGAPAIVWYRSAPVQNQRPAHRGAARCGRPHGKEDGLDSRRSERVLVAGGRRRDALAVGACGADGRAAGRRRAARRRERRRRRHQRRHLLHHPRPRSHDGRPPIAGRTGSTRRPGPLRRWPASPPPRRRSSTLWPRPTTSAAPATGPTARPAPQVRRLAARRRRGGGQRPRPVHPGRRPRHDHLPGLGLLRDRRAPVLGAAAPRPAQDAAARLRAAQPRHRRERAQHGGAGSHPLPGAADRRAPRPSGAHQVRQPAAGRRRPASSSCRSTRPSPARAPAPWAATRRTLRTGRRCTCTAASRRGSAAARRTSG